MIFYSLHWSSNIGNKTIRHQSSHLCIHEYFKQNLFCKFMYSSRRPNLQTYWLPQINAQLALVLAAAYYFCTMSSAKFTSYSASFNLLFLKSIDDHVAACSNPAPPKPDHLTLVRCSHCFLGLSIIARRTHEE